MGHRQMRCVDKCVIWGLGTDYEIILNQIKYEILKRNIEIVAVISDVDSKYFVQKDGFKCISKDKLLEYSFDFLIIASGKHFREIVQEAVDLGVCSEQIINGKIFERPLFDWNRYISLIKDPITILSDDCWGGYIYHELYLQFSSPCVNVNWPKESFVRFAKDPMYYFSEPLEMEREGDIRNNLYPIGRIGSGDKLITMDFVHVTDFKTAKQLWDRRKKRVNPERIFVKLGLPASHNNKEFLLHEFDSIKLPKVCFYSGETDIDKVVYLPRFEWFVHQGERAETMVFSDYVRMKRKMLYRDVDILKMLNEEDDFIRTI